LASVGLAVALAGWTRLQPGRARKLAVGLALAAIAVIGWKAPKFHKDYHRLGLVTDYVNAQHSKLKALLDDPRVRANLRSCHPLTTPTHNAVPIVRLVTGLSRPEVKPSTAQRKDSPPTQGDQLIAKHLSTDRPPKLTQAFTAPSSDLSTPRPWTSRRLPGFFIVPGGNARWKLYSTCVRPRPAAASSPRR
ncbi:MAG TPA: hypothetical protein VHE14_00810, partial [Solirubrobacteraceae bacterium]|nr:hypothetical protein [Solirubrobacteraceae bacterium]